MKVSRRSWKNLLLMPNQQVRLGMYSVLLTMIFSFSVLIISLVAFETLYMIILDLIPRVTELRIFINTYMWETIGWLSLAACLYIFCSILLAIWVTHRWIGPTVAFRRHIEELKRGNYAARVTLRKGDAFHDLAREFNELSSNLEAKQRESSGT